MLHGETSPTVVVFHKTCEKVLSEFSVRDTMVEEPRAAQYVTGNETAFTHGLSARDRLVVPKVPESESLPLPNDAIVSDSDEQSDCPMMIGRLDPGSNVPDTTQTKLVLPEPRSIVNVPSAFTVIAAGTLAPEGVQYDPAGTARASFVNGAENVPVEFR